MSACVMCVCRCIRVCRVFKPDVCMPALGLMDVCVQDPYVFACNFD